MEKIGILVVSYGSREAAMIDTFARSGSYKTEIFVVDKQKNPFNMKLAAKHVVIPDLDVQAICHFAKTNRDNIDFGIVGPEKPIVEGVRDLVEKQVGIPMICPTLEFAIEKSKVEQRRLLQEFAPEVNPRFRVFDPKDYGNSNEVKKSVCDWLDELDDEAVVKPDKPAAGKGVGVWGDHFTTREQLLDHFFSNFQHGQVIIEEKIEGEESSFQAFSDGKHLVPLPDTRDYKRAFDNDRGPNTGGMGSYKNVGDVLPFLTHDERNREVEIARKIFDKWKRKNGEGLRGVPLYLAFIHSSKGPKVLENNSRPGDPEIMNVLPLLKDDFVDLCFKMLEGNLSHVEVEKDATVVIYKAPSSYGGYEDSFPNLVQKQEIGKPVDLSKAYALTKKYGDKIRVYPGSMELRNRETYALKSRTVAVLGIGENIEMAREFSLEGVRAIEGGALWHRSDIASEEHIEMSRKHMNVLRSGR